MAVTPRASQSSSAKERKSRRITEFQKQGVIHQYVDENDTAFHAGVVVNPTWPLMKPGVNPNFYTIGIEHEGRPDDVWPEAQLTASAGLIGEIVARWNIPVDALHLVRHHQIRASQDMPRATGCRWMR